MSLTEQLCVFALASAVAVPAMLTFRDAKNMASSQVEMVAAYQVQMQGQPGRPYCLSTGQEKDPASCKPLPLGSHAPSPTQGLPENSGLPPLARSQYPLPVGR